MSSRTPAPVGDATTSAGAATPAGGHVVDPAGGCPHALNAELRAQGSVADIVLPGGVPAAVVLGHDTLKEFLSHPDVAKDARHCPALNDGTIPADWPLRVFANAQGMHTADGADHRRLRSLVGNAFTARQVERLRPRIEELTTGLLDDLARAADEDPDGVADLRTHNAVRALCTHRDQLTLVLEGKATWAAVVDETLRWDGPVSWFPFRYPTRDLALGGSVIPQGTPVLAGYTAAGRDEDFHGPDADRFDITRPGAARHLSFGHGAHYCVGAPLARLEATIALERLFTRFPDLELAVPEADLPRQRSFIGNSVEALPVRPVRR
ncbi:cytochrome P450 [Streptomyces sp. NPDC014776]|uniref:cytochrome P450 n=1 Tax=Streptomyces sp. NPDC014776 TaxID=3364909 RepID=UPI0036F71373